MENVEVEMATQHVNPYLQWKKWKNDLRMEAFLLTCRISGGFFKSKNINVNSATWS